MPGAEGSSRRWRRRCPSAVAEEKAARMRPDTDWQKSGDTEEYVAFVSGSPRQDTGDDGSGAGLDARSRRQFCWRGRPQPTAWAGSSFRDALRSLRAHEQQKGAERNVLYNFAAMTYLPG